MLSYWWRGLTPVLLFAVLSGCDTQEEETVDFFATLSAHQRVLSAGYERAKDAIRQTSFGERGYAQCGPNRFVDVGLSQPSSSTLEFSITFEGCEGLNGQLTALEEYQQFATLIRFSGEVEGGGCQVRYDQFDQKLDFTSNEQHFYYYDGAFTATCGQETRACRFENVAFAKEEGGPALMREHCD